MGEVDVEAEEALLFLFEPPPHLDGSPSNTLWPVPENRPCWRPGAHRKVVPQERRAPRGGRALPATAAAAVAAPTTSGLLGALLDDDADTKLDHAAEDADLVDRS